LIFPVHPCKISYMPRQGRSRGQALLALAAMAAILVVSIAAVIPGHWHNSPQGRICDICRTGWLAAREPVLAIQIQSPAPVGWHRACVELHSEAEPVFTASSPRAPPA